MNLQLFTKWYAKYVLFALCCILLLVVPLLKGPWIGSEPFLYSRLADDPSWFDTLSNGGMFAAYPWGTALVLSPAPSVLIQILPFLLGLLSFVLFRKILERYTQDPLFVNISLLLFILSPAFLYTFSFANSLFLAFFLSLAAFYFFSDKKKKMWSIPLLIILPLFHLGITFTLLLLLFLYSFFWKKDRRKFFYFLLLLTAISSGIYYGYILYHTGIPNGISLEAETYFTFFQKIFFDLGSTYGLGIFICLLALIGLSTVWYEKYSSLFFFFSLPLLLLFSLFRPENLLFLSLLLILFATKGILYLLDTRWTSRDYKHFMFLIIICGLVFSSISQLNNLVSSEPSPAMLEGLAFLSEQEKGVVFSDYSRGVLLNAAGKENILDENYLFVDDAEERYLDSQELFYSRDLGSTTALFEKYEISYVWIDPTMKESIWSYDTEGLLFILEYTKSFKKIYDKDGVEIWRVQ